MTLEEAEAPAEIPGATLEGSDRKSREQSGGASNVTARRETFCPEEEKLMEAVVETQFTA